MKRALLALSVAAIIAALVAPSASAATKDAHGWWWRAQSGLLGTAIPPPGVPEDGLAVETLPDGPTAVSAVRYLLDKGESQPVLELTVVDQQGEIAIQACTATQHWTTNHGGPWDERPTYDCGSAAEGQASEDGATWTWELAPLLHKERINVVLVPAPGTGRVTFEAPDDSSLRTQRGGGGGAGSPDFDPPPVSDFNDPPPPPSGPAPSSGGFTPPSSTQGGSQPPAFSSQNAGSTAVPPPQAPAPAGDQPVEAQPPLAAGPVPTEAATPPASVAAVPASSDQSRTIGAIIAAMATVLGLSLWHQDTTSARRSAALANAGIGASSQPIGGLGRFARPRTGTAPPLL